MVLLALDLHLMRLGMISIMPSAWHQGPWRYHQLVFLHYNISHGYTYGAQTIKIEEKDNHLAPAGCLQ